MSKRVQLKALLKDVPEDVSWEICEELIYYFKRLQLKYGVRFDVHVGPFYSTVESVKSGDNL